MTARAGSGPEGANGADFTPRQIRILKIAVLVMGVVLIVGFATLLGTIFYQSTRLAGSGAPGGPVADFSIALRPGQTVESLSLDGNRVALHLSGPGGREIAVVDLARGRVVSRVRLAPE